jgi:hypothetical protein
MRVYPGAVQAEAARIDRRALSRDLGFENRQQRSLFRVEPAVTATRGAAVRGKGASQRLQLSPRVAIDDRWMDIGFPAHGGRIAEFLRYLGDRYFDVLLMGSGTAGEAGESARC